MHSARSVDIRTSYWAKRVSWRRPHAAMPLAECARRRIGGQPTGALQVNSWLGCLVPLFAGELFLEFFALALGGVADGGEVVAHQGAEGAAVG